MMYEGLRPTLRAPPAQTFRQPGGTRVARILIVDDEEAITLDIAYDGRVTVVGDVERAAKDGPLGA